MARNNVGGMKLPSVDELFSSEETRQDAAREKVMDIPISEISDFPDHPFKVHMDESMQNMAESIKQYGILHPILVRPKENGGYEMIAGHRRKMACELAGIEVIPCIVREMSRDEAAIAMVDSNIQRENIYRVFYKEKASETNTSCLGWTEENIITLVTCVENVPNLRWVVQACEVK